MQQAARVSQRTAYFHLGKLIEVGETNQIFTNPRTSSPRTTSPDGSAEPGASGAPAMTMSGEEHTFKRFDQELTHLNSVVLRMGGLVEDQIAKAMAALREADLEAARNVVAATMS